MNGVLYTRISSAHGVLSGVYSSSERSRADRALVSGRPPGIWGRAGVRFQSYPETYSLNGRRRVRSGQGIVGRHVSRTFAERAAARRLLHPGESRVAHREDLDMGNVTPVVFQLGDKDYLAGGGKEGRIFLLDTSSPGGETHRTPFYRSELLTNEDAAHTSRGFWGAFATFEARKERAGCSRRHGARRIPRPHRFLCRTAMHRTAASWHSA